MAEYRLKIKIGEHEFEADGPVEAVTSQFEAFKELMATLPNRKAENTNTTPNGTEPPAQPPTMQVNTLNADRIFRADGRVVSLTVAPTTETAAVLLILY